MIARDNSSWLKTLKSLLKEIKKIKKVRARAQVRQQQAQASTSQLNPQAQPSATQNNNNQTETYTDASQIRNPGIHRNRNNNNDHISNSQITGNSSLQHTPVQNNANNNIDRSFQNASHWRFSQSIHNSPQPIAIRRNNSNHIPAIPSNHTLNQYSQQQQQQQQQQSESHLDLDRSTINRQPSLEQSNLGFQFIQKKNSVVFMPIGKKEIEQFDEEQLKGIQNSILRVESQNRGSPNGQRKSKFSKPPISKIVQNDDLVSEMETEILKEKSQKASSKKRNSLKKSEERDSRNLSPPISNVESRGRYFSDDNKPVRDPVFSESPDLDNRISPRILKKPAELKIPKRQSIKLEGSRNSPVELMTIKENNLECSQGDESKCFEKSKITVKNSWIPDSMSEISSPSRTPQLRSKPSHSSPSDQDRGLITPKLLPKMPMQSEDNLSPEIAPNSNRTIKTNKRKQTLSRISSNHHPKLTLQAKKALET